jgi:AcrR family transcriptional regulator
MDPPVPRPRFDKLPTDKRQRILETAALEFASRGFEHASLNRIISAAGISKGAAYYYFDDKADLFATVLLHGWQVLAPETDLDLSALDTGTFWPTLFGAYAEMLRKAQDQPWLTAVGKLFYRPPSSPALRGLVADQVGRAHHWLREIVARGQSVGVVRRDVPGPLLLATVAAAAEAADRWLVDHAQELPPEQMEPAALAVFDMLRRLVEPSDQRGPR